MLWKRTCMKTCVVYYRSIGQCVDQILLYLSKKLQDVHHEQHRVQTSQQTGELEAQINNHINAVIARLSARCEHICLLTERCGERHAWDVQAALVCQKEEGFHWQALLLRHRGGGEVRGKDDCDTRHLDMSSVGLCSGKMNSLSLQTWRHHPAGTLWGQQAAVDGGNGWKRTCMNIYALI